MRILVLSDNAEVMSRVRPLFEAQPHKFVFATSEQINPRRDHKEIVGQYSLIFSIHCKTIFPRAITDWVRCINVHPGYNPYNRGMFPHVWSIINGLPAGVTIHEMDAGIDTGPTIFKEPVDILPNDTSLTLYNRIIHTEVRLLAEKLPCLISGSYEVRYEPKSNYNSLEDFKKLCVINPQEWLTAREFYNRIRALSHGDHWNAQMENNHFKILIK